MQVSVNDRKLKALKDSLKGTTRKVKQELRIVLSKTAKAGKGILAREVIDEIATTQKAIKSRFNIGKEATATSLSAIIRVDKSKRIPLADFKPRQTKTGVTYVVNRRKGRQRIKSAFIIDRYNRNVYRRRGQGRAVGASLKGVSPWGVLTKGRRVKSGAEKILRELTKQINRRLDYLLKKKSGVI